MRTWIEAYRSNKEAIWIKVRLTDGREFFCDDFDGWYNVKNVCDTEGVFLSDLSLQFRSHEVKVDLTDADGVYMAKSARGVMGGKTSLFYVTGIIKDGMVTKQWWHVPELVKERRVIESFDQCFKETLIHDNSKTTHREE